MVIHNKFAINLTMDVKVEAVADLGGALDRFRSVSLRLSVTAVLKGLLIVASSCFPQLLILSGAKDPTQTRESRYCTQSDNQKPVNRNSIW